MNFIEERKRLVSARDQMLANFNVLCGQIAMLDQLIAEEKAPLASGEDTTGDAAHPVS